MKIIENTLRDGSYTVDFQMTKEDTSSVVKELAEVGFEIIEILLVPHGGWHNDTIVTVEKRTNRAQIG